MLRDLAALAGWLSSLAGSTLRLRLPRCRGRPTSSTVSDPTQRAPSRRLAQRLGCDPGFSVASQRNAVAGKAELPGLSERTGSGFGTLCAVLSSASRARFRRILLLTVTAGEQRLARQSESKTGGRNASCNLESSLLA